MYVCMYVDRYVCMYVCVYVCMHAMCFNVCLYAMCMHAMFVFCNVCTVFNVFFVCMHVRMYVRMYVCTNVRMYMHMYVPMCVCMYVLHGDVWMIFVPGPHLFNHFCVLSKKYFNKSVDGVSVLDHFGVNWCLYRNVKTQVAQV